MVGRQQTGEVKYSIGNREAKEFTCTTYGQEQRRGECWRGGRYRAEGDKGEKKMEQL